MQIKGEDKHRKKVVIMEVLSTNETREVIEQICNPSNDEKKLVKLLSNKMKSIFDKSVSISKSKRFGMFDSLIVDGLDADSIWEELQSRNQPLTDYIQSKVVSLSESAKNTNIISDEEDEEEDDSDQGQGGSDDSNQIDDYDSDDDQADEDEQDDNQYDDADSNNDEDDDDDAMDDYDFNDYNESTPTQTTSTLPLTDEEEEDMEEYLDELERSEMRHEAKMERKAGLLTSSAAGKGTDLEV